MLQNYNIFKNLILFAFVVLVGVLIYKIQFIVILFFAAFIVASAVDPLINALSRKMPRKAAVIVVTITGLALIVLLLVPFINLLIVQALSFTKEAPVYWEKLYSFFSHAKHASVAGMLASLGLSKWAHYARHLGILPSMQQVVAWASNIGQNILSGSIDFTRNLISSVMFVFTLAMLTLFMLIDKEYLKSKILSFFPQEKRERTVEILHAVSVKVGGYLISQIIVISDVGVLVTLGLLLIKVKFALILGVLAAVLELIPVVGPIATAVIIGLAAVLQKPVLAVFALVLYGLIQWLVDNIIRPMVVSRFLEMHPLTFIFSLFIGAAFWGIPGIILAPAIVAAVCVLIDELYLNKLNPQ